MGLLVGFMLIRRKIEKNIDQKSKFANDGGRCLNVGLALF